MTAHHARTLVVIVNYRIGELVVDCLRSLLPEIHQDGRLADVVVVDNQSGDNSVAIIQGAIHDNGWGAWARLVESPVNGGFAYGNNVAVRDAQARGAKYDYFWLLNPDTIVRPGALRELLAFVQSGPHIGMVGSGIEEDASGQRWPFVFKFPNVLAEFESGLAFGPVTKLLSRWAVMQPASDAAAKVDWLSGCSFVVRREVFEAIGLMDEQFFLYYEETDFCRRAGEAGWQCWYVPSSRIYHMSGRSTGASGEGSLQRRMPAYWFESRRRYYRKHHSRLYTMLADAAFIVALGLSRVRHFVQRKPDNAPPHYLRDFIRHSAILNSDIPVNPRVPAQVSERMA